MLWALFSDKISVKSRSHTKSLYLRHCRSEASSLYRCKEVLEAMLELSELWGRDKQPYSNSGRDDGGKEARSTGSEGTPERSHTGLCSELRHLNEAVMP